MKFFIGMCLREVVEETTELGMIGQIVSILGKKLQLVGEHEEFIMEYYLR